MFSHVWFLGFIHNKIYLPTQSSTSRHSLATNKNCSISREFLFVCLGVPLGNAQGFILALNSGITANGSPGNRRNTTDQIWVGYIQSKCLIHCIITLYNTLWRENLILNRNGNRFSFYYNNNYYFWKALNWSFLIFRHIKLSSTLWQGNVSIFIWHGMGPLLISMSVLPTPG